MSNETTVDTQGMIDVLAGKTGPCPCHETENGYIGCEGCTKRVQHANYEEDGGVSHWDCVECKGTGQVATFPSLRRDCDVVGHQWEAVSPEGAKDATGWKDSDCRKCQGNGWLPVSLTEVDLNALLMEVRKIAGPVDLHGDGKGWWLVLNGHPFTVIYYDTPAEAIIAAIHAAVQE